MRAKGDWPLSGPILCQAKMNIFCSEIDFAYQDILQKNLQYFIVSINRQSLIVALIWYCYVNIESNLLLSSMCKFRVAMFYRIRYGKMLFICHLTLSRGDGAILHHPPYFQFYTSKFFFGSHNNLCLLSTSYRAYNGKIWRR